MINFIQTVIRKIRFKNFKIQHIGRSKDFNVTAVKSSLGFWYVGNIFNESDISYGILRNGVVEEHETNLVSFILKIIVDDNNKLILFDVGANTGYYGIMSAYMFKDFENIKVFSFEPIEEFSKCLKESTVINNLNNKITVFDLALSNTVGSAEIELSGSGTSLTKGFNGDIKLQKRQITVTSLDVLYEEGKIELPDFIKIDVEGHEFNVLSGAQKVIKLSQPIIFLEIAKTIKSRKYINNNYEKIIKFLLDFDYNVYVLLGDKLKKVSIVDDLDGVNMYLCLSTVKHKKIISLLSL